MKLIFIVVAAGKGERFNSKINKLLYNYNSKPLISYTLKNISKSNLVNEIILVVRKEEIKKFKKIVAKYKFKKVSAIIEGGEKRQDSVYNALLWLEKKYKTNNFFVAIHDGARINVKPNLIKKIYYQALKYNAAVPAIKVSDTVKEIDNKNFITKTLNREKIVLVQTPQIFKFDLILNLYKKAMNEKFYSTDDSAILEKFNKKVKIVEGDFDNIKITFKEDLKRLR
jgi:2-C-methyl-D-erythritol 4-phosphate cytidylyltransferase